MICAQGDTDLVYEITGWLMYVPLNACMLGYLAGAISIRSRILCPCQTTHYIVHC